MTGKNRPRASTHELATFTPGTKYIPGIFFSGEGPRSRRYGRTAALRLLVQPCDEDDDDDDYFLSIF
jgi:hypothetical protein